MKKFPNATKMIAEDRLYSKTKLFKNPVILAKNCEIVQPTDRTAERADLPCDNDTQISLCADLDWPLRMRSPATTIMLL